MQFVVVSDSIELNWIELNRWIVVKDDFSHCCPHGYQCNVEENKCDKGISIPWFTKKPANYFNISSTSIQLPKVSLKYSTIQCPGYIVFL